VNLVLFIRPLRIPSAMQHITQCRNSWSTAPETHGLRFLLDSDLVHFYSGYFSAFCGFPDLRMAHAE
jgi:hypothetical protein